MECNGLKPDYLIDQQNQIEFFWQFLLNDPTIHSSHSTCTDFTVFKWVLFFPTLPTSRKQTMHDFLQTTFTHLCGRWPIPKRPWAGASAHLLSTLQCLLHRHLYFFINEKTVRDVEAERERELITRRSKNQTETLHGGQLRTSSWAEQRPRWPCYPRPGRSTFNSYRWYVHPNSDLYSN